jgi:hypothetical protein
MIKDVAVEHPHSLSMLDRGVDLSFALRKLAQPEPRKHKETKHAPAAKVPAAPAAKVPAAPAPALKPAPRSEPVPL